MIPTFVMHVTGPVLGARQECARCGVVLQEYTGDEAFRLVDLPDPTDPSTARTFWPVGERVLTTTGWGALESSLLPDRDTTDESECARP